jgi:glycosyltransferase involved in cell wall biosynthesis
LGDAELFVLIDGPMSDRGRVLAERIRARGGEVQWHGTNRGLSAARNSVLDAWPDHHVLFIDDDVRIGPEVVAAVSAAFTAGAQVVGARLVPPEREKPWPWFFTEGQMHLVGWHSAEGPIKIWGACMGIDAAFAHRHELRFDGLLGRTGNRLESGDDTSFVAAMKAEGAHEQLLPGVRVVHDVDPTRLTLRYLSRRAYWQGRSEVRRGQAVAGLRKEWTRHRAGSGLLLATGYTSAFAIGIGWEFVQRTNLPHWGGEGAR